MRVVLAAAVLLCACTGTTGIALVPITEITQVVSVPTVSTARSAVDLLFVIDNSMDMTVKIAELTARFPEVLTALAGSDERQFDLHIGVVTSDLGAGTFDVAGCRPGGDGAEMRAIGRAAPIACAPLADGGSFIRYDQRTGTHNLPASEDLATAFACMASVGEDGCGFEQPLEAAYLALSGNASTAGFRRSNALLAVVFLADEDDCSADASSDLFDPAKVAQYGVLDSYRCVRHGIICDGGFPPYGSSGGALSNCRPATQAEGGKLIDVQKYINFLSGAFVTMIAAPPAPVESILARADATPGPYQLCAALGPACRVAVQRSCIAPDDSAFHGDPAVRLAAVVDGVGGTQRSICDTSYVGALQQVGTEISSRTEHSCLTRPIANAVDPVCAVELDGAQIDRCDRAAPPCWRLVSVLGEYLDGQCAQLSSRDCNLPASCKPVYDPRTGAGELFRLDVDLPAPLANGQFVRASCEVLVPSP